ncbi:MULTISPECIES: SDR family NAD(P)-dependent oxidoreductase [unclassified Ensifer]|uniref:SDR family NAD(P)-dependent oxidoreductase n=1 Tax=unclassified Ensifer TaxID=2633371 RepID=UPI000713EF4F|nr:MULTISPECIES: SDR family NAD(P)-dependent oxidoreductase [unclassified Ensifer]KQX43201.1 oxidoreductase [Ensifer sp. Root1298]KQX72750.1 oxidoreductase [Ensifer sp. Root1312]KRC15716.1 oxidoreductase [Ensifer sp. Root74]KRD58991.1 oxidoreductase [Ensifer sp. Root954]
MTERMNAILAPGRVAVVTGAAKGLGASAARAFAAKGMDLVLFDKDEQTLMALANEFSVRVLAIIGDVADEADLGRLRDETLERFGDVAILMNNAGIIKGAGPWDAPSAWKRQLDVNFGGILTAQHLFVPQMIEAPRPSAVINLGSKEGITTPPGNAAYSVAKAGVKVLTEQLSHELLKVTDGRVSAHLLVPGYTWTPMNFPGVNPVTDEKPSAPWTAEQVIERLFQGLYNDEFYVICPDNEVTSAIDAKRIRWAADDMIENRPALSRWHPEWKAAFAAWLKA